MDRRFAHRGGTRGAAHAVAAALVAAGVALGACGDADRATPREAPPGPPEDAPRGEEPAAADATRMPHAGEFALELDGDAITLRANAAPRRLLLERLARELGFALSAPDVGDEPISARSDGAALRDLLPTLLPDRAYRVAYRYDPALRAHRVARLEVARIGEREPPGEPIPENDAWSDASAGDAPARAPETDAGASDGAIEVLRARDDPEWRDALERLAAPDWNERVRAVEWIDAKGDGIAVLAELLARDPHPKVRAAAAEELGSADTPESLAALVAALSDADKDVVLEAIDALEFTDDESIADEIRPLERHPDPEIAEAARDAVCFIGDDDCE